MNLFVTSDNPVRCARYLDDIRANKMLLETAQMLSTALHFYGHDGKGIYRPTHINHPVNKWVRETSRNYLWAYQHYDELCNLFFRRRGKQHASASLTEAFADGLLMIPSGPLTPFVNCARRSDVPLNCDYTHIEDVFLAYRMYLHHRWAFDKRTPTWR